MICHYCGQPLAKHEAHDLRVMRPVHKACHVARLADPPTTGGLNCLMDIREILLGVAHAEAVFRTQERLLRMGAIK